VCRRNAAIIVSSASVRTVERGSLGPVFKSATVARLRHFATVLGLIPSSLLNCASEDFPFQTITAQCTAGQWNPVLRL
jgi:hypothetical protein